MDSFHSFGMTEVATNAIVSMRKFKRGERDWAYKIALSNGADLTADSSDVSILLERPTQLIPAASGTSICHFNDEDSTVYRAQVIAWALCADGEVRPVTPAGVNDCEDRAASIVVELPDGTCHERWFDGSSYPSLEAYIENRKAWAAKCAAEKLAREAGTEAGQ
ncbi:MULTISPECIES: hypothetical protein [unclassified Sphingomonas]|uniref:hypothetical protein n=1 Tax=unclassified Sphingomonas TaxID=196159 RepID=UPI0006F2F850|nr:MULTISPECIES: hypothetical protein [unclassified Sphingomonas]KQX18121.1 hypothetical protein ASD17_20840 [Sphingomonas sp. Root1294]KQY72676.1 hypothetical protein ASD39_17955 [Sphingomonas sp. Root50]KRB87696.1 hypothetical protein ASE22_23615 [Sphingomonas sp. Root720]